MFIGPARVRQNLNHIATPTHPHKFGPQSQKFKATSHDATTSSAPGTPTRKITLATTNRTAAKHPGTHSKLAQALGRVAEEPARLAIWKTSNYPLSDDGAVITQAAIDALCAPLKESIMNNRKRTKSTLLLTFVAATLLLSSTSIQVAHAANPLDPSFYQWRSAPRDASVALEAPTRSEQRNPLSPAYQFRADLRWELVAEDSVRANTYRAQTHPLHPSFKHVGAS